MGQLNIFTAYKHPIPSEQKELDISLPPQPNGRGENCFLHSSIQFQGSLTKEVFGKKPCTLLCKIPESPLFSDHETGEEQLKVFFKVNHLSQILKCTKKVSQQVKLGRNHASILSGEKIKHGRLFPFMKLNSSCFQIHMGHFVQLTNVVMKSDTVELKQLWSFQDMSGNSGQLCIIHS